MQAWRKAVEDAGYYIGVEKGKKEHFDGVNAAYAWATSRADAQEFQTALRGERKYAAAVQLALENADFIGNDPASKTIILGRTESERSVTVGGALEKGDVCPHKRGANESHSHWRGTDVYGSMLTMIRVPYPRVSAFYFAERNVGSRSQGQFLDDRENEFTADTHGLAAVFIGDTRGPLSLRLEDHHADFKKYEQQAKGGRK